ncbi:hypothetical protein DFH08DRAFT_812875 [Mycena albidolilacea]|uniref:Uncharacterized protein n=1 Tax=Mycena albidolilacea TaxID=1033008 RepID=A0AAD6ZUC0_9AGAR|nr:hypothetical protein DFH08DRAFT_812875 [Mycena albidolilacea]
MSPGGFKPPTLPSFFNITLQGKEASCILHGSVIAWVVGWIGGLDFGEGQDNERMEVKVNAHQLVSQPHPPSQRNSKCLQKPQKKKCTLYTSIERWVSALQEEKNNHPITNVPGRIQTTDSPIGYGVANLEEASLCTPRGCGCLGDGLDRKDGVKVDAIQTTNSPLNNLSAYTSRRERGHQVYSMGTRCLPLVLCVAKLENINKLSQKFDGNLGTEAQLHTNRKDATVTAPNCAGDSMAPGVFEPPTLGIFCFGCHSARKPTSPLAWLGSGHRIESKHQNQIKLAQKRGVP